MREQRKSPGGIPAGLESIEKKPTRFGGRNVVSLERARKKAKA
jgi:hypothetical protein